MVSAGSFPSASRRRFLVAAGASAVGAAALRATPAGAQTAPAPSTGGVFDVRAYGAVGDGTTDDTAALQRTIDAAQAAGGGRVLAGAGRYLVRPPGLRITGPVQFEGTGWAPVADPFPPASAPVGSWLLCDTPGTTVVLLEIDPATGRTPAGAAVRGVAVAHRQPGGTASFRPADYPAAIRLAPGSTDIVLEDLLLLNPTRAVEIGGAGGPAGRILVRRLRGQPLTDGIVADGCYDLLWLDDIHFWGYWRWDDGPAGVQHWVETQGAGVTLYRCDNPMLQRIFCFGYAVGLAFRQSRSGTPHKVKLSDSDFDLCGTGVLIAGVGASGYDPHTFVNVSMQGPDRPDRENRGGIVVDGRSSQVRLSMSNVAIYKFGGSGIHLAGAGTSALIDNVFIQDVNLVNGGAVGIRAVGGARARVGWQREITVANGGPETDGEVALAVGLPAPSAPVDLAVPER